MKTYKAYFTPGLESVSKLADTFLFGEKGVPKTIDFAIDTGITDKETRLPLLEAVIITPVEKVCVTSQGFEISGSRAERSGVAAKLTIDTTVEPPVAIYEETEL